MTDAHDVSIHALQAYADGDLTFDQFERVMALANLWGQGVQKPTIDQIEARISEMRTAAAFISAAPE
ncbi:MAG: hypothetical protein WBB00_07900 [Mycobacterium sp.]